MKGILWRRTCRELRAHIIRYLALFLMISLSMYLIVSLLGAADTVILGSAEHAEQNRIEDGQFTVFVPLTEQEMDTLREAGAEIEPMFYREYERNDESVLRVFRQRKDIDRIELESGAMPEHGDDILLEKRYCEEKDLKPGDRIDLAGRELTVCGIATVPDYEATFRNPGDSTVDSDSFSTAFATDALYDELADTGKSLQAEEYLYAWRLKGDLTANELKEKLKKLKFTPEEVEDPYFQEFWDQTFGERDDLLEGTEDLAKGSRELSDALAGMESRLRQGAGLSGMQLPDQLLQGMADLHDAGEELADGNEELKDAVQEMLDKYDTGADENLRSFLTAEDNPRIGAAADDVIINKYASILAGLIILALMAYVISVFVIHGIEEEKSVIGTLYALGVRRKELLLHYLVLPVLVSFAAGAIGTAVGYSRFGVPLQTADTYAYFSVPSLDIAVEWWIILYGVAAPPLIAALVNWLVIRRKLSAPALQMIRKEEKRRDVSRLDLKNMGYIRRFQIRQLLREGRSAAGVVLGIFVCLLLMMIGLNAYVMCDHVGEETVADTKYEYMYLYKYPEKQVPEGGYGAYAETLKKEAFGYNMDVTVLGLEENNPFFDVHLSDSESRVAISSAMAQKYGLREGDSFTVNDPQDDRAYAFTAEEIVPYSPGFYVFMDVDSMRDLFDAGDDYFNVVFADRDLHIDSGRLYSVSSREDVVKAADVFIDLMAGMVYTMVTVSFAIMGIVMYLMMKVMVDRSAQSVALFKVFGYRKKELRKLFLNGNTVLIVLGSLLSIPLSKKIMDAIYPYLVSNVACSINVHFDPWMYGALFGMILLLYALIHLALYRRLDRTDMHVILKNRE